MVRYLASQNEAIGISPWVTKRLQEGIEKHVLLLCISSTFGMSRRKELPVGFAPSHCAVPVLQCLSQQFASHRFGKGKTITLLVCSPDFMCCKNDISTMRRIGHTMSSQNQNSRWIAKLQRVLAVLREISWIVFAEHGNVLSLKLNTKW